MKSDVFKAIVSMCTKRILLRLRLSHSKRGEPKQTFQEKLRITIDFVKKWAMETSNRHSQLSKLFVEKARLIIKAADAWTKHQTVARLEELVDSVYRLKRTVDIEALLHGTTSREIDPSNRRSLINIVNKIARYREIARYLCRLSKNNTLVRRMELKTIDLPAAAYERPPPGYAKSTLSSMLTRGSQPRRKAEIARIRRFIDTPIPGIDQQYASQVTKTLTESKIHAEIQLLYHLEMNPSSFPPRVIASSKDACFLCNAFISMHEKMHTTRTHGRLYPGWRLPAVSAFVSLQKRFNILLADHINASLATLTLRGARTIYPDPNESTLLTLPYSASTLRSLLAGPVEATKKDNVPPLQEEHEEYEESMGSDLDPGDIEQETQIRAPTPSVSSARSEVEVVRETANTLDRNMFLLKAGRLHLHMEYSTQSVHTEDGENVKNASFTLEWLRTKEAERLVTCEPMNLVDVEQLSKEATYDVAALGYLIVAGVGEAVRIEVSSTDL
jgi:hypothetical protein